MTEAGWSERRTPTERILVATPTATIASVDLRCMETQVFVGALQNIQGIPFLNIQGTLSEGQRG